MNGSLPVLMALLFQYRYYILFPAAVIEGPITAVIGGFFASLGILNAWLVYLFLILGDLVGDSFLYLMGRFGKRTFLTRYGRYVGMTPEREERLEARFAHRPWKPFLIGKTVSGAGSAILFAAGAVRMSYVRFFLLSFLITAVKSLILLAIGYYFGQFYYQINNILLYIALGFTLILLIYFLHVWRKERKDL